jgi:hypothetical protein
MVEDVGAWLPHSPMLAFDILPSHTRGLVLVVRIINQCQH